MVLRFGETVSPPLAAMPSQAVSGRVIILTPTSMRSVLPMPESSEGEISQSARVWGRSEAKRVRL